MSNTDPIPGSSPAPEEPQIKTIEQGVQTVRTNAPNTTETLKAILRIISFGKLGNTSDQPGPGVPDA